MSSLLAVLSVILLAILVYQDFRYRSVSWILLPGLFLLFFISTVIDKDLRSVLEYSSFNGLFVLVQLALVCFYFWIKNGTINNFTGTIIGWGDIIFFLTVTPVFPLPLFILYIVSGMLLTLLVYFVFHHLRTISIHSYPIPLAGILAAYLIILKSIQWIYPQLAANIRDAIVECWW